MRIPVGSLVCASADQRECSAPSIQCSVIVRLAGIPASRGIVSFGLCFLDGREARAKSDSDSL